MTNKDRWRIRLEAWRESPVAILVAMSGALLVLLALLTMVDAI